MTTQIIAYIISGLLIGATVLSGIFYLKPKKRQAPQSPTFRDRKFEVGVINNGTSMNNKAIYVLSVQDLGL